MKPLIAIHLACLALLGAVRAADKSNMLIILSDDQGYADAGFQGSKEVPTPHLDHLAREGVRCTSGYVTHPYCSPSRAGLLTGRHQARFGHERNPYYDPSDLREGLPLAEKLLPEYLREAGYATGWIGKWHLGAAPEFWPEKRGFAETFGFIGGGHQYQNWQVNPAVEYRVSICRNGQPVEVKEHLTLAFGHEAAAFVRRHATEPWFLYLAFNAPHTPHQPTPERLAKFEHIPDKQRRAYLAQISLMDDAIGEALTALKETGQTERTLVFFFSDNGGPTYVGANNDPLRGMKGTTYEGGVRVPFVVSWPGKIPQGKDYAPTVSSLDVFPTALACAGVTLPTGKPHDGVNLIPFLTGEKSGTPHQQLFWRAEELGQWGERDGAMKLVRRTKDWAGKPPSLSPLPQTSFELFDLSTDLREANNLAAANAGELTRMNTKLDEWRKQAAPLAFTGARGKEKESAANADRPNQVNRGDLVGNMQLLNLWGERPDAVQRLYEAAYKILAAKPDASFPDLARDATVQQLCAEVGVTHFGGPMLGAVRPDGAAVWLRTLRPSKVEVRVTVDGQEKTFGPVASTEQSDLAAVVEITGLKPHTRYPYRVWIDGEPINTAAARTLVTSPAAGPAKARIAFGSCFHRWGLGNEQQAAALCQREPTALLVYGDVAVQDRDNHLGLHRADYLLRDFHPAWQRIAASVPVYATWDDHDYFNNDKWGAPKGYTEKDRQGVWEVFRHAWNNPSYGFNDDRRGVFFRTRVGPCDVIMVDHRYFRTARGSDSDPGGNFLGQPQMQWLEKQLLDCKGPFVILSCGTMWSDYVSDGKDSWGKYDPKGREEIFSLIEKHRIPGVLLTSGDRHGARVFRIPRPSGYNFYEFEPASLGGRGDGPPAILANCDAQLFGVAGKYAFGEFSFDATLSDPQVVFRLVQENGAVLFELKLTRSQLTPPGV